jgi:hypothetical protein
VYRLWDHVTSPLLRASGARMILEIGAGAGAQTRLALEYCREHDGMLTVIDPAPVLDVGGWMREWGSRLHFVQTPSLEALPSLGGFDVALIDGDHNWYTVIHELRLLSAMTRRDGHAPVLVLHDTGWPYGRRDMYYDPARVPADARQPHEARGLIPGEDGLVSGGLLGEYLNAARAGGPKNGVLTAVHDFAAETGDRFRLVELPGLHGLAILAERTLLQANTELGSLLDQFTLSGFARAHLARVEHEHLVEHARLWRARAVRTLL